jgi:hypothetical protein
MQTLAELKAANAAEEEAAQPVAEEARNHEELETETEGETQTGVDDEEDAESGEESSETDTEDWMRGDEQGTPDADKKFGDGDVAAAKRKLRAKLERQHQTELEKLQQEIEELKKSKSEPQPDLSSSLPPHPKWDDFADKDNPEAAYTEALVEYNAKAQAAKAEAAQKAEAIRRQREEQSSKISQAVDQHYDRAVGLAEKSGISADAYKAADLNVRQMIDSVIPGGGDPVTDALIANLGEGSERVMYNLGVNSGRRAELEKRLREDSTGLRAMAYLAELNATLKAPSKRTSNAPAPSPQINGDKKGPDNLKRLRQRYDKAKTSQARYEIRKEARQAGVNTRDW